MNSSYRTFDQFQQCLLYAFTETSRVMDGLSDLREILSISSCRQYHAVLSGHRSRISATASNDVFNVFTHITGFGQCSRVAMVNGTSSRRASVSASSVLPNRSDRSAECYFCPTRRHCWYAVAQTFVMVVYRDRQHFFRRSWPIT